MVIRIEREPLPPPVTLTSPTGWMNSNLTLGNYATFGDSLIGPGVAGFAMPRQTMPRASRTALCAPLMLCRKLHTCGMAALFVLDSPEVFP